MSDRNPYPKSATGHRKFWWLNTAKPKSVVVAKFHTQDACGSYSVSKYRGRYYCSRCGSPHIYRPEAI